ncbi:hypothetical protein JOF48_000347 [Arthrobacter stackebrandtii]|uniref:Capsular polysaccharide biosynthesis protein n=1 Tax=Arthrobacter stackebrandtii TaxID=272161 RepID=A0ABS4YRX7_9MICC|nr:hypothetical protein [Arthrobacter stackebrandtii]MBP2411548.1 hypothetical protein [Arthrobacter stackebrandtii]PYG99228.1 hypothetical protein CVV67_16005 [Arthrobacter stackebrandtii]
MKLFKAIRRRLRRQGIIMVRRWYLTAAVLALMLPLLLAADHAGGVYYSTANLLFLPPPAAVGGNSLSADPGRTVYYAAMVERRFNADGRGIQVSTTDAPLYSTGVRQGYKVYVPNAGGQWQTNFNRPLITVEVVGPSPEAVAGQFNAIVDRLDTLALAPQVDMGVKPVAYITTELAPAIPNIMYIGVRNKKALLILGLLTLGLVTGVPQLGDRAIRAIRRRRRHQARQRAAADADGTAGSAGAPDGQSGAPGPADLAGTPLAAVGAVAAKPGGAPGRPEIAAGKR